MTQEIKVIFKFEKNDLIMFNQWKKTNNYSLRKIGKEINISYTYIDDMVKGRRALNQKFFNWLVNKGFIKERE